VGQTPILARRTWGQCWALFIFTPRKMVFCDQKRSNFMTKNYQNLGFQENPPFFRRKIVKKCRKL
jgi:hypothetical protein